MTLSTTRALSRGRTLAVGFGTTVAMWAIAYVSMLEPGFIIGEILFVMLLGSLVAGGIIAGADAQPLGRHPLWAGAKVGLTVALLNLMIVGSMLIDPDTRRPHPHAPLWIAGNFAVSLILAMAGGWIGGVIGRRMRAGQPAASDRAPEFDREGRLAHPLACAQCGYNLFSLRHDERCPECGLAIVASIQAAVPRNAWYYTFLCVAGCAVFLLLITGGLVTGLQAGLAVPDWPNSFGHNMLLYPASQMVGGVFYEHAHRLYGMLVGVTAITVAVSMFFFDSRGWMRGLGIAFLIGVSIQGVLGGTRVTETSLPLAIVHGVFAQILFATITCIAAFASPTWRSTHPPLASPAAGTDRIYTVVLVALMIVQVALGALYRHLQRAAADPPEPLHPLWTHIGLAALLTILIIFVAGRAWGIHRDQPVLPVIGRTMLLLLAGQLLLGVSAMIVVWMSDPKAASPPWHELVITTAHQVTGAMMLAMAALLMFWTRRLLTTQTTARLQ